jgi:hypothetical protein
MSWLSEVFEEARRNNWCTRISCTTCRADRLRGAVLRAAMERAGVRPAREPVVGLGRGVAYLTARERRRVVDHIIIGLRTLNVTSASTDALRLVLHDMHPPLLRWGVGMNLHDELLGTPAGDELRRMEEHAAASARARQAQRPRAAHRPYPLNAPRAAR